MMTFYRPEGPVKVYNDIHNLISNILFENKEFIMMGDVNANLLSKPLENDAKHMKNIYDSNNLTQLITEPTGTTDNTKTLIDHAVTNRPSQIVDSGVIPCGISHHDSIYVLRKSRLAKIKKEHKVVNIRNFKRFTTSDFVHELEGLPFDLIKDLGYTPDEMWYTWKTMFLDVLNKHAPTTSIKIRGDSHPYLAAYVKFKIVNA